MEKCNKVVYNILMLNQKRYGLSILSLTAAAIMLAAVLLCFSPTVTAKADGLRAEVGTSYLPQGLLEGNLWYLDSDNLDVESARAVVAAWAASDKLPDPTASDFEPVKVAVIDTGISYSHELFEGLLIPTDNGGYLSYDSYNEVENGLCALDVDNHGTHVCGIIATVIKSLGLQDYIKIIPIRATSIVNYYDGEPDYSFSDDDVERGMEWAYEKGADVITMSLGSSDFLSAAAWQSGYMHSVVNSAKSRCIITAAAGNDGKVNTVAPGYPALCEGFVSVMSYAEGGKLANYSNYGNYDIAAPGSAIYSSVPVEDGESVYAYMSGTSMATPVAAAAAAVLTLRYKVVENMGSDGLYLSELLRRHSTETITSSVSGKNVGNAAKLDFNALLTDTFVRSDYYLPVTEIRLITDGLLNQTPSTVSPVNFTAELYPAFHDPSITVEWYVNGNKIAEGLEFPVGSEVFGTYEIYAKLKGGDLKSETVTLKYGYGYVDAANCRVVCDTEKPLTGRDITLTYLGSEDGDPSLIEWYVNNEKKANGSQFVFNTDKSGEYTITVKLGGENAAECLLTVNRNYTLVIVLCSVFGALAMIAAITAIILLRRRKAPRPLV